MTLTELRDKLVAELPADWNIALAHNVIRYDELRPSESYEGHVWPDPQSCSGWHVNGKTVEALEIDIRTAQALSLLLVAFAFVLLLALRRINRQPTRAERAVTAP